MSKFCQKGFIALIALGFISLAVSPLQAQFFDVRQGNQAYKEDIFSEAEDHYNKVLNSEKENEDKKEALFNKGNAAFRQEKYEDAQKAFEQLAMNTQLEKEFRSEAFFNNGNVLAKQAEGQEAPDSKISKLEQAKEQYKNAIKLNPKDLQAKQNFEIVDQKINQLKELQEEENKDQDKEKEKKEEKKEQEQEQEQQENKEEQKQPDQQNKQQPQPKNFSKEQAERILNALKQDEKQMLQKYQQKPSSTMKFEKDW